MKATANWFDITAIMSMLLGMLVVYIVTAVPANTRVPFVGSDRAAFFSVFVLGFIMCAIAGIGRTQVTLGWLHPITIIGTVLGILALVLAIAVFTGRTAFLSAAATIFGASTASVVSDDRVALIALTAIIFSKWGLGLGKYFLRSGCAMGWANG